jgi:hypothetical protein
VSTLVLPGARTFQNTLSDFPGKNRAGALARQNGPECTGFLSAYFLRYLTLRPRSRMLLKVMKGG